MDEGVLIGGNHLATVLIGRLGGSFADKYPPTMPHAEALELMGAGDTYDVWCCWRAIMRARGASESNKSWPFPNIREWEMDGDDDVMRIRFVRSLTLDEVKAMSKALADLYHEGHKPNCSEEA